MVTIDINSALPLEDQIRSEIHRVVAQGAVKPGDALPSVRQLAGDLGIHWNTVARAYRRLRDDGLLTVGRGRTVTVRDSVVRESREPDREANVGDLLDSAFTRAKLLGLSYDEMRVAVENKFEAWRTAWEGGK